MPADAAEINRQCAEVRTRIDNARKFARSRRGKVLEKPTHHNRIPDRKGQGTEHGKKPYGAPDTFADTAAAHLACLRKRPDRARFHSAPERHFTEHAREAEEGDEDEIRDQKRRSAEFRNAVREQPDVAHAHRRADARDDERRAARKAVARLRLTGRSVSFGSRGCHADQLKSCWVLASP